MAIIIITCVWRENST